MKMLPELIFHIRQLNNVWQAKADKDRYPAIEGKSKPAVVQLAVEKAKEMATNTLIIIHGLDGRILEQRRIQNT